LAISICDAQVPIAGSDCYISFPETELAQLKRIQDIPEPDDDVLSADSGSVE
jgi:hypothetical protein